jgi:hypothetical protein
VAEFFPGVLLKPQRGQITPFRISHVEDDLEPAATKSKLHAQHAARIAIGKDRNMAVTHFLTVSRDTDIMVLNLHWQALVSNHVNQLQEKLKSNTVRKLST